jgi:hypothetical protein
MWETLRSGRVGVRVKVRVRVRIFLTLQSPNTNLLLG